MPCTMTLVERGYLFNVVFDIVGHLEKQNVGLYGSWLKVSFDSW